MQGSLILYPICGAIFVVGLLLATIVAVALNRLFRRTTSATDATVLLVSAGVGILVFVMWFVFAWGVLYLLATILLNET